jgi:hypothetical protein
MNRVIFSISTFIAVFCSIVVGGVILSMTGLYEIDAIAAYAVGSLLGVDLARRVYRWERPRRLAGFRAHATRA